jgi:hypothetical protein
LDGQFEIEMTSGDVILTKYGCFSDSDYRKKNNVVFKYQGLKNNSSEYIFMMEFGVGPEVIVRQFNPEIIHEKFWDNYFDKMENEILNFKLEKVFSCIT